MHISILSMSTETADAIRILEYVDVYGAQSIGIWQARALIKYIAELQVKDSLRDCSNEALLLEVNSRFKEVK